MGGHLIPRGAGGGAWRGGGERGGALPSCGKEPPSPGDWEGDLPLLRGLSGPPEGDLSKLGIN